MEHAKRMELLEHVTWILLESAIASQHMIVFVKMMYNAIWCVKKMVLLDIVKKIQQMDSADAIQIQLMFVNKM